MSTIAINKRDWVGTKAQYIALNSIETNRKYYITDLETFVITNSAMASALTTYAGLYNDGDVFLCVDSGTYTANTFYKLNSGAWVELGGVVSSSEKTSWNGKQDALVSGTNIKTINNESLLGSGNITISGSSAVTSVNTKTGAVVLNADDISDSSTTNKFVTANDKTNWNNKVNDTSIALYNGNAGNPNPVRFMSVDYNDCTSENGVFVKVTMVSGHGNGVSYKFLQDATFNVSYMGDVAVDVLKTFGASITYDSATRQYGDIFWTIDTTNKIVTFYTLMGQYATLKQSPYKRLNSSSNGTITQYTSATIYSSGTKNWANGGDIATMGDIPSVPTTSTAGQLLKSTSTSGTLAFGNSLPVITTAPSSANNDGLIIVVLSSEPATKYAGYLYIITSAS